MQLAPTFVAKEVTSVVLISVYVFPFSQDFFLMLCLRSEQNPQNGTMTLGGGSGWAYAPYIVTPLDALKARAIADDSEVFTSFLLSSWLPLNSPRPRCLDRMDPR